MTVYLLMDYTDHVVGVFKTGELAQLWLDKQVEIGAWTAGERAMASIEPNQVCDHLEWR